MSFNKPNSAGLTIWQKREAPENVRPQNSNSMAPKGPPNFFFVPCFSVSARGPKESKVPRKHQAPKFKNRGPKERSSQRFFVPCFSTGSKKRGAPKSPRPPKANPKIKKCVAPMFKKRGSKSKAVKK